MADVDKNDNRDHNDPGPVIVREPYFRGWMLDQFFWKLIDQWKIREMSKTKDHGPFWVQNHT